MIALQGGRRHNTGRHTRTTEHRRRRGLGSMAPLMSRHISSKRSQLRERCACLSVLLPEYGGNTNGGPRPPPQRPTSQHPTIQQSTDQHNQPDNEYLSKQQQSRRVTDHQTNHTRNGCTATPRTVSVITDAFCGHDHVPQCGTINGLAATPRTVDVAHNGGCTERGGEPHRPLRDRHPYCDLGVRLFDVCMQTVVGTRALLAYHAIVGRAACVQTSPSGSAYSGCSLAAPARR